MVTSHRTLTFVLEGDLDAVRVVGEDGTTSAEFDPVLECDAALTLVLALALVPACLSFARNLLGRYETSLELRRSCVTGGGGVRDLES